MLGTCKICNKELVKFQRSFCSKKCCHENEIVRRRKYDPLIWKKDKKCKICNNKFIPYTPIQYICSQKCRDTFNSYEYKCKYGNKSGSGHLKLRFEVFKRDNFTCQYCGRNIKEDNIKLHCDHKIPKIEGGKDELNNLITSCKECNLGKSDVLLINI